MASPAPATIPEDLLLEIFLRLPTVAALARAAAACTSFRHLIKGRAFRRRFRSLHRPPLLGFMDAYGFHPAEPPHPSAPLARALATRAEDFSFVPPVVVSSSSYSSSSAAHWPSNIPSLLKPGDQGLPRWRPRDARDGRVLLDWVCPRLRIIYKWGDHEDGSDVSLLMDCTELTGYGADDQSTWKKRERCNAADFHLAVCDPLSHMYELLPTIPEDMAAWPEDCLFEFVPMLAPAAAQDDESFKVICLARYETKLALFVFMATPRQWRMATFPILAPDGCLSSFDCVHGCFYWTNPREWSDYLLVLDTRTMMFSYVPLLTGYHLQLRDLPHDQSIADPRLSAVVVGREGAIEMFCLVGQDGSFAFHHTSLHNDSQEWKLEKIIPLPAQYKYYSISTVGAAEGFLFFQGAPEDINIQIVDCYSLEVKTYEITKVCSKMEFLFNPRHAIPFCSFPPLLSEPAN